MKFLVDAQLPARLVRMLNAEGHDALHTSELPRGNASTDAEVTDVADADQRVVVSKDRDFRDSHLITGKPRKLLIVSTGNLRNDELLALFSGHLQQIVVVLEEFDLVEMSSTRLIAHADRRA